MTFRCMMALLLALQTVNASGQSLQERSIEDLVASFSAHPKLERTDSQKNDHSEAVLMELAKRGSEALVPLDRLRHAAVHPNEKNRDWSLNNDLALLSAIRRIEGKSPPLKIRVVSGAEIRGSVRIAPEIPVEIVNVDEGLAPVWFKFGGDYRSGRLSRWRIHVWDQDGTALPVIGPEGGFGGGLCHYGELKFGETDERKLDLGDFVRIREPGVYHAKVFYHNSAQIADIEDPSFLDDLFLCESEVLTFTIDQGPAIEITLTDTDNAKCENLISRLDFETTIKTIGSKYDPSYHEFIAPDSAHGQLLALGETAVPAVLARLTSAEATYAEKAWMLGLLESILHERHLASSNFEGAIDRCHSKFPGGYSSRNGQPSPEIQTKLIDEWITFTKKHIHVQIAKSNAP